MKLKMLTPDASRDGKIIFRFVDSDAPSEVILVPYEVDYTSKDALLNAKKEAATQAKAKIKEKKDASKNTGTNNPSNSIKENKREKALAAILDAGLKEEDVS